MADHRCRRCGTALRSETLICPECGARQQARTRQVRCRYCSKRASAELTLCPTCGRVLQPAGPPWRGIAIGVTAVVLVVLILVGRETVVDAAISPVRRLLSSLLRPLPTLVAIVTPTATVGFEPGVTYTATPPVAAIPLTPLSSASPAQGEPTEIPTLAVTGTPDGVLRYRVRSGDSVYTIAKRFGVTEDAISEANGLRNPDSLQVGQILIIPQPSPTPTPVLTSTPTAEPTLTPTTSPSPVFTPTVTTTSVPTLVPATPRPTSTPTPTLSVTVTEEPNEAALYRVHSGDSVFILARRFGVTEDAITEANHLTNPGSLKVDQPLIIPRPRFTPTPSLSMSYPAPKLLKPDTGSTISGSSEARIELTWESVGTLAADEWYAVSVFYLSDSQTQVTDYAIKGTSWRVPRSLYGLADPPEHLYLWNVTVVRLDSDGDSSPLSLPSITHVFRWP